MTSARSQGWLLAACLAAAAVVFGAQAHVGAQRTARMLDESGLSLRLWTPDPERGYVLRLGGMALGVGSEQDAIRLDVRQGRRTIATVRCPFYGVSNGWGSFGCETDREALLTADGDLTIEAHYLDDVSESSELLRTFAVRVNAYPYWVRSDGRRQIMGHNYQIDASDMLGTAFVFETNPHQTEVRDQQFVRFFAGFSGAFEGSPTPVLRCTANGERIADRRAAFEPFAEVEGEERLSPQSEIRRVRWYRGKIESVDLWWGVRPSDSPFELSSVVFLGDHPGAWSCALRRNGRNLRVFDFQVDQQGRVVPHAEEQGPAGMRLIPGLHLVEVRIPTPPIDEIVDPVAIRRGSQYGRPWADPASVRAMLGDLPPALGSAAPSRGRGRR